MDVTNDDFFNVCDGPVNLEFFLSANVTLQQGANPDVSGVALIWAELNGDLYVPDFLQANGFTPNASYAVEAVTLDGNGYILFYLSALGQGAAFVEQAGQQGHRLQKVSPEERPLLEARLQQARATGTTFTWP